MNKILVFCFALVAVTTQAQEINPFKINVSVGYAVITGRGASGGVLYSIEPKYAVTPRLDLGLRYEQAFLVRGLAGDAITQNAQGPTAPFSSYLLTATHYFSGFRIRPFVGVGAGMFSIASAGSVQTIRNQTPVYLRLTGYTTLGGLVRVGLKTDHFVASVEYNAVPHHTYTASDEDFTTASSYVGFRIGFDVGGGLLAQ